jgi:hypothetical protein
MMPAVSSPIHTIDLAHPPRHPDRVEEELQNAWQMVRNSSSLHILKIIHGYGSSGRGGSTRTLVRNWAFQHRDRFRSIINGEEYTLFDPATQTMRRELPTYDDPDIASGNPGMLVIWVR